MTNYQTLTTKCYIKAFFIYIMIVNVDFLTDSGHVKFVNYSSNLSVFKGPIDLLLFFLKNVSVKVCFYKICKLSSEKSFMWVKKTRPHPLITD